MNGKKPFQFKSLYVKKCSQQLVCFLGETLDFDFLLSEKEGFAKTIQFLKDKEAQK